MLIGGNWRRFGCVFRSCEKNEAVTGKGDSCLSYFLRVILHVYKNLTYQCVKLSINGSQTVNYSLIIMKSDKVLLTNTW